MKERRKLILRCSDRRSVRASLLSVGNIPAEVAGLNGDILVVSTGRDKVGDLRRSKRYDSYVELRWSKR